MHVVVATDGSPQSLAAARHLTSFADPAKITGISVVAVVRPLASVAFADQIFEAEQHELGEGSGSFRAAAQAAGDAGGAVLDGRGAGGGTPGRGGTPARGVVKEG